MQRHAGLHSVNHLGADCGVVDVCPNVDAGEDGHNVECKSIAHCIYHHTVSIRHEVSSHVVPIKRSGTSFEMASHARYIDPRL